MSEKSFLCEGQDFACPDKAASRRPQAEEGQAERLWSSDHQKSNNLIRKYENLGEEVSEVTSLTSSPSPYPTGGDRIVS